MKVSEIDKNVKLADFENFFNVYENQKDLRKQYVYNLNSTIYFDGIPQLKYKLTHDMFWTTLSYEIYKTTRLWWVLMKLNNVKIEDTFNCVKAGETIKYIDSESVRQILLNIGDIS